MAQKSFISYMAGEKKDKAKAKNSQSRIISIIESK